MSLSASTNLNKRGGDFIGSVFEAGISYIPLQNLEVGLQASLASYLVDDVAGLRDLRNGGFNAFGPSLTYRFLTYGEDSPIGLSLSLAPQFARLDDGTGERAQRVFLDATLALDTVLVKDKVYAALNLTYEGDYVDPVAYTQVEFRGGVPALVLMNPGPERENTTGIGGALAFKLGSGVQAGVDARYLRNYSSLGFSNFDGHAIFLGTNASVDLTDSISLSAAYALQVWGHAKGRAGDLDLINFPQHQAKVSLSFSF